MATTLKLQAPAGFDLKTAVCSYGYYQLAPNQWHNNTGSESSTGASSAVAKQHAAGCLTRPLRLPDNTVVQIQIRQKQTGLIAVECDTTVPRQYHREIKHQVSRMLRMDECFKAFHQIHKPAKRRNFACIFRSPTLFEDVVKTITSCNMSWGGTKKMNEMLCTHVGKGGDFPTPAELARWKADKLAEVCRVGYRAPRMIAFAQQVAAGKLNLDSLEHDEIPADEKYEILLGIDGVGPYAARNIMQHLGHYHLLPIDSETIRHFKQHHLVNASTSEIQAIAEQHYDAYHPYQFLAYWFELWTG